MSPYSYQLLRERSRETWVPAKVLWSWWHAYQQQGLDGLLPSDWTLLDEKTQSLIAEREQLLGEAINAVTITPELVHTLVERNHWSPRTAARWIRRYQIGGWWGSPQSMIPKNRKDRKRNHCHALLAHWMMLSWK